MHGETHNLRVLLQGNRVWKQGDAEVWVKPLSDGSQAVVLFNRSQKETRLTAPFEELHLAPGKSVAVRDLWNRKDLGRFTRSFGTSVPAHAAVMVKVTPENSPK